MKEHEHFIAHIVDTSESIPKQASAESDVTEPRTETNGPFLQYEIPIRLMMHNRIASKIVQATYDDECFNIKGLTFTIERSNETNKKRSSIQTEVSADIAKIDLIYNHEYEKLIGTR